MLPPWSKGWQGSRTFDEDVRSNQESFQKKTPHIIFFNPRMDEESHRGCHGNLQQEHRGGFQE